MTMPKKKARKHKFRTCQFCTSPYRYQIENAWKSRKLSRREIYQHFMPMTGHKSEASIEKACHRHFRKDHFEKAKKIVSLETPPGTFNKMTPTSLDELAQGLMDIGGDMVKFYQQNPLVARKELSINEIMKAQDSVTNRMKVQVTQNALKLMMAKMFGGFVGDPIEGEIVDEDSPTALLQ